VRINHPVVGELTLGYGTPALPSHPGLSIGTYLPDPGSPPANAPDMLRSWIAEPIPTASDSPTPDGP
jgi:hypothetical protein